ncbi:MAG: wax ester/triacylglycerol synthase family O-acyltransferase [Thermoanaerobaculia bacterium]|nr:wax ester/triacylglycerol synthase family O-acyltransferase [Thermoanaerobaculia bacterium]
MQQLSGLDASFLTLETDNAPMHVGGVSIVSGRTPHGPLKFEAVRELLASRVRMIPTLQRKLASVPLGLGRPYWVDDDAFDLGYHLQKTQLPAPSGRKELRALVNYEFARTLDRDRPLWQILFVENVDSLDQFEKGSVALITRVHHAAIDGISGAEIMAALYDPAPDPPPPGTTLKAGQNDAPVGRGPTRLDLLRAAGRDFDAGVFSSTVAETVRGLAKSGAVWALGKVTPPPLPFSAPSTLFNQSVSQKRSWSGTRLQLERFKAIRRAVGCTVNDAVLAVCSGALRAYLEQRAALPERSLVAMVPVSIRDDDEAGSGGNLVSAMLVSLATDVADPQARLEAIQTGAKEAKTYHQAIGARTLMEYSRLVPFGIGGLAARLYTRGHLAEKHKPIFNVVITNVPGPQVPLYLAGAELLAHYGTAPIFDGVGLIMPVFSYNGTLSISASSCPEMLDDARDLTRLVETSLHELEAALGLGP